MSDKRAMASGLPIIFVNYNFQPYLAHSIGQAKLRNMASPVFVLGDASLNVFPFATYVPIERYLAGAARFRKAYRHMSSNDVTFESFCFMRWFALRDFARDAGLGRFLLLDSDVLVYVDVNQEASRWSRFDLTLGNNGYCPGNVFVHNLAALDELCHDIETTYTDPRKLQRLTDDFLWRRVAGEKNVVSDMRFLKSFYDANRPRVGDMTGILDDGSFWDSNLFMSEGLEMEGRIKSVRFENGLALGRSAADGSSVRLNTLHFAGHDGKQMIEPFFARCLASQPNRAQRAA